MKKKVSKKEKEEVKPFRVWDELAEMDILIEYMRRFVDSNINTSADLYPTMIEALYANSTEIIPEVEQYYGEKLHFSLNFFLDKIALCQNPKQ